jgi:hypothetical protein
VLPYVSYRIVFLVLLCCGFKRCGAGPKRRSVPHQYIIQDCLYCRKPWLDPAPGVPSHSRHETPVPLRTGCLFFEMLLASYDFRKSQNFLCNDQNEIDDTSIVEMAQKSTNSETKVHRSRYSTVSGRTCLEVPTRRLYFVACLGLDYGRPFKRCAEPIQVHISLWWYHNMLSLSLFPSFLIMPKDTTASR